MNDSQFVPIIEAWLRDTDPIPPEPLSRTERVMSSVQSTSQLGRHWPPELVIPELEPAISGRGRDRQPIVGHADTHTRGALRMANVVRLIVAGLAFVLLGGALVLGPLRDTNEENSSAFASPSPAPTGEPDPDVPADSARQWFIGRLQHSADPIGFTKGPNETLAYIDRDFRSGTAVVIDYGGRDIGGLMRGEGPSGGLGDPTLLAEVGEDILVVDHRDRVFRVREAGGGDVGTFREDIADGADLEEDISALASEALPGGRYRLYALDPAREQILRYDPTPEERGFGEAFTYAEGIGQGGDPIALHVDGSGDLYALTADGVRVYRSGIRDDGYALAAPPDGAPAYRSFTGTDRSEDGRLFLYDAASERILVFDKASGEFIEEWTEDAEGDPLTDVRGLAVVEQIDGSRQLFWGTPRGLFAREISTPVGAAGLGCTALTTADLDPTLITTLDELVGEPVSDVDSILADLGYCYEYHEAIANRAIPGLEESFSGGNRWCVTPPAGEIVAWNDSVGSAPQVGRLQLSVLAPDLVAEPSRPVALGCALERPQRVVWDSGSARLEADTLRIEIGDQVFTGDGLAEVTGDTEENGARQFAVYWYERGVEQRLNLEMDSDDSHWWVKKLWTYDGIGDGDWVFFDVEAQEAFGRIPLGQAFEGDLHLTGSNPDPDHTEEQLAERGFDQTSLGDRPGTRGELVLEGLRLAAYEPGTGAAPLEGCEPFTGKVDEADWSSLTPKQAERKLKKMGVCYEFRYEYDSYAERWCKAPPGGEFSDATVWKKRIKITYYDYERRGTRRQPPGGWKCPTK